MIIRGQYHTQLHNISVDLPSHLFENDAPVVHHEATHYYLSHYTNEGAVLSVLAENCSPPKKLVVDKIKTDKARKQLHEDMYEPQEGFAHLMQSFSIYDDGGDKAIKDWEDCLPNKPKSAFSYLKYVLKFSSEQRDLFTGKISNISLNNNLYLKVIEDPNILINGTLEEYFKDENHSTQKRFEKSCRSIEKDNTLLNLTEEEICEKIGLSYHPLISNKDKANLINAVTTFTDSPTSVKESDIRSLNGAIEALSPAFQSIIVVDANLTVDAHVGLNQKEILDESNYFRTLFVYNNPESPQKDNHFGFYSFSRKRNIINGVLEINNETKELFTRSMTRISDTASFDFTKNKIKPERSFVNPSIVWHKNYLDLMPFLEMAEKLGLTIEKNSFAFTDPHPYRFYILKVKGSDILHIAAGYPFIETKIAESKFQQDTLDFFEIIKGKEHHLNNFFHDVLGIPYLFNLVEMITNAESHLKLAVKVRDHGMPVNDPCICGSKKKYKKCHGL